MVWGCRRAAAGPFIALGPRSTRPGNACVSAAWFGGAFFISPPPPHAVITYFEHYFRSSALGSVPAVRAPAARIPLPPVATPVAAASACGGLFSASLQGPGLGKPVKMQGGCKDR